MTHFLSFPKTRGDVTLAISSSALRMGVLVPGEGRPGEESGWERLFPLGDAARVPLK